MSGWTRRRAAMARRLPAWWLLFALFVLLVGVWLGTNPPGSAPDEKAHLVKAVAAGRLHVVGVRPSRAVTPLQQRQLDVQSTRIFTIPGQLVAATFSCNKFDPHIPASCLQVTSRTAAPVPVDTYVATYAPYLYVPAGVAARFAHGPFLATYLARAVFAAVCVVLLAIAVRSATSLGAGPLPIVGLLLGLTPTTMFLASSLNISGIEIVASVALMSALLAASRRLDGLAQRRWSIAFAACVLVLSRSEGAVFAALDVCVYVALRPAEARAQVRFGRRRLVVPMAAVVACLVAVVGWQRVYGPTARYPLRALPSMAGAVWRAAPFLVRQATGMFGWFDTSLPSVAFVLWWALVVALFVFAVVLGRGLQRVVVVALGALTVVAPIVIQTVVLGPPGAGQLVQARYVLPLAAIVPLVAAEVLRPRLQRSLLDRPSVRRPAVVALAAVAFVLMAVHVDAVLVYARRNAVGVSGDVLFFQHPLWSPPLGWVPWLALMAVAAVVAVLAAVVTVPVLALTDASPAGVDVDRGAT